MGAQAIFESELLQALVASPAFLDEMVMYAMTDLQYQTVYNTLSFGLASMMATTMYLWFRSTAVHDQFKSAVLISGLVTFIAAYHYFRIFNSWVDAYSYHAGGGAPTLTGVPFNDAYRYMDWLLTAPLLLIEILLVMKLDDATFISMAFFLYIVQELLVGLAEATNRETGPAVKSNIQLAQVMTVISWCTYPVVYLFPMLGITASHAVVGIQVGYCCSDIISKCGVGLLIYQITYAKSKQETLLG